MRAVLLLIVLSIAVPAWADPRATRAGATLRAAERELARGDAAAAARRLRAAILAGTHDPGVVLRYLELTLPLVPPASFSPSALDAQARAAETALRALRGVSLSSSEDERARRAALHVALGAARTAHFGEALAAARAAGRREDPATLASLREIAALAAAREQLELAEEALALARTLVPQDLSMLSALGRVQLARGRPEAAVQSFAERFAIPPRTLAARRDLAYALAAAGRPVEGLSLLETERAACEAERGCALEAARIALEADRPDSALGFVERRLAAPFAADLELLYVAADAHTRARHFEAARAIWERVLTLRPQSARARQALALLPAPGSNAPAP